MLGNGGSIALRAPVCILGFPDADTDWSFSRIFKELERPPRRISGKRDPCRRAIRHEFGGEPEKFGNGEVGYQAEAKHAEKPERPATFGPEQKSEGRDEARIFENVNLRLDGSSRSFPVNRKVEDASPLTFPHLQRAAHHRDERVRRANVPPPSTSAQSFEERLWTPDPATHNASQGDGKTSGRQLQEPHSEAETQAPRDSDGEDWRRLSRALATSQKFCNISNHDLMRIAELRFSSDMQEGDTGGQVALLQKALFWLGFLSKSSYTPGFFGTETKQALCEFQEAHGLNSTGLWGSLSKQALWHNISGEILHRAVDGKASEPPEAAQTHAFSESGSVMQTLESTQSWNPGRFAGAISAAVPGGDWRLLVAIVFLLCVTLFGFLRLESSGKRFPKDNSTKRRIIVSGGPEESALPFQGDRFSKANSNLNERTDGAMLKPVQLPLKKPTSSGLKVEPGLQHSVVNPYRLMRKSTSASSVPLEKAASPDTVVEADRQPTSMGRSAGGLGSASVTSQPHRPDLSSSNRRDVLKMQTERKEPFENSSLQGAGSEETPNRSRRNTATRPSKNLQSHPTTQMKSTSQWARDESDQHDEHELSIRRRIEELREAVEAAEQNGQAAMHALAEERKRSLELEEKISRQREAAAALEAEVRVLKESHDVLLASLRKKLRSAPESRATSLLYQAFNSDDDSNGDSSS